MATLKDKREALALMEEKLARRARSSFGGYVRYIDIPGVPMYPEDPNCERFYPDRVTPAEHHDLIISTQEKVITGELTRVMYFFPPGTAKSSYISVAFPPAFMARLPASNIIATSYGADLSKKFGRKCRQIVRSPEYYRMYHAGLVGDNTAVDDWSLDNGSTYMCGGILSAITGNRADCLLIDDPVKGREDADSPTIRDKTWEAYQTDLRTRLKPGGAIVLIQTRWHEDDLAGRILPEDYKGESGWVRAKDGEMWWVVNLPAQCERADDPLGREIGDWLWTDWFPVEHWEREKKVQSVRNWSALYQQRPAPESGSYFKLEDIRRYQWKPDEENNGAPKLLRFYGASDYAVTKQDGDYTVHGVAGFDTEYNMFVTDWWRKQTASDVWIEAFLDLMERWKTLNWAEEAGQINKSLGPFIERRQRDRKVWGAREQFPSAADKVTRSQPMIALASSGKLYLPSDDCPWVKDLISEMLSFDNGVRDDQVDVLSLFGRMLDKIIGKKETKPKPRRRDRWERAFDEDEGNWKTR